MPTLDELVAQLGGLPAPSSVLATGLGGGAGAPPPLLPAQPSNVTKLTNKWAEFSPFVGRFPSDVIEALVEFDAERVARGSQPLTREQTVKAAVAAAERRQVTAEPERSVSPLEIPGNALADLRAVIGAIPALPQALVEEVRELPQIPQRIAEARAGGAGTIEALATAPGVRLVPGAFVAENLSSPGELARHPLFTVLDVLPVLKAGAARTTVGRAGAAVDEAVGRRPNPLRDVMMNRVDSAGDLVRSPLGEAKDAFMAETRAGQLLAQTFGRDARDVSRMFEERGARLAAVANGTIEPADAFERMLRESASLGERHGLSTDDVAVATRSAMLGDLSGLSGQQLAFLDDARRLTQEQGQRLVDLDELGSIDVDGRVEFYPRHQAERLQRARDVASFTDRMSTIRSEMLGPTGRLTLDDFRAGLESSVRTFADNQTWGRTEMRAILYTLDGYGHDVSDLRRVLRHDGPEAVVRAFDERAAAGGFDNPAPRMSLIDVGVELRKHRNDVMADRLFTALRDANTTRVTQSLDALLRRTRFQVPALSEPGFVESVRSLRDRMRLDNSTLRRYTPERAERMQRRAERIVSRTPPARFEPVIGETARRRFTESIMPGDATPAQAAEISRLALEARWPRLADMTGRELDEITSLRNSIVSDVERTWREMQQQGVDPVFVHKVTRQRARQVAQPRVGPVPTTLSQAKQRFTHWGEPDGNLTVSLSHQAMEVLSRRASEEAIDVIVRHYGIEESALREQFGDAARAAAARANVPFEQALRDLIDRRFEVFNPDQRGYTWGGSRLDQFRQEQWWIPKPLADNLHRIASPKGPISAFFDPVTHTFRLAVIGLSPRTHLYNILGGAVMLFGQAGPRGFANLRRAWELTRDPTRLTDETVRATLGSQARHFTDAEFARATASSRLGMTMRRILDESDTSPRLAERMETARARTRDVIDKSLALNGLFDDMYRVAAYLTGHDQAVTRGLSKEAAEAAGRELMRRTMMDWTALTPIERGVFKSIFPFYGFMSHALKYVSRYPVDHPMRASVVAAFGRAEQDDLGGLPQSFLSAMFVGDPDSNRNALQLGGVNPFNDVGNLFTVSGFLASSNPAITTALEQVGVLRGEAELYPTLRYDPTTGRLTARHQNPLLALTENIIPQTAIATSLLGVNAEFNDRMRFDPAGARRSLLSAAGLPVIWRNFNVPAEIAKAEVARQRSEDLAKRDALASGDWTEALRYPGLRDYYSALTKLPPHVLEAFTPQDQDRIVQQVQLTLRQPGGTAPGGGI